MSAMEITDRRSSPSGELVFWRGRDGDGRETYAARLRRESDTPLARHQRTGVQVDGCAVQGAHIG